MTTFLSAFPAECLIRLVIPELFLLVFILFLAPQMLASRVEFPTFPSMSRIMNWTYQILGSTAGRQMTLLDATPGSSQRVKQRRLHWPTVPDYKLAEWNSCSSFANSHCRVDSGNDRLFRGGKRVDRGPAHLRRFPKPDSCTIQCIPSCHAG